MDNRFFNISEEFLRLNRICIDHANLKEQLYTQDSYPSLKALTDVLSAFSIKNRALKIKWEQLMEYGTPVMLHYQDRMPSFVIATHVMENEITYYTSDLKKKTETRDRFLEHWNGVALYVIEPDVFSWKCYFSNMFKKHRLKLLLVTICLLLFSLLGTIPIEKNPFLYGSFILKLTGLFFSIFLLRHDWGKISVAERHFCVLTKLFSCDAVLSSNASKLFGIIKMSDIGMVYFMGGLACLLSPFYGIADSQNVLDILAFLSFCSFPYILFSLSYQHYKIKKWCPLCLGVLTTLSMEIVLGCIRIFINGFHIPSLYHCYITGLFFLTLALTWNLLNSIIKAYLKIEEKELRYLALKRDSSVFRSILDQQLALDMHFSDRDILIGNRDNKTKVTIAINPFCTPCLDLYKELQKVLNLYPNAFCLNIRFMSMDEEIRSKSVGLTLMSLYYQNKESFTEAFEFWIRDKDYEAFQKRFSGNPFSDETRKELQKHFVWRKEIHLNQTPVVFVGNRKLPGIYTHEDLFYFLKYGKIY